MKNVLNLVSEKEHIVWDWNGTFRTGAKVILVEDELCVRNF